MAASSPPRSPPRSPCATGLTKSSSSVALTSTPRPSRLPTVCISPKSTSKRRATPGSPTTTSARSGKSRGNPIQAVRARCCVLILWCTSGDKRISRQVRFLALREASSWPASAEVRNGAVAPFFVRPFRSTHHVRPDVLRPRLGEAEILRVAFGGGAALGLGDVALDRIEAVDVGDVAGGAAGGGGVAGVGDDRDGVGRAARQQLDDGGGTHLGVVGRHVA